MRLHEREQHRPEPHLTPDVGHGRRAYDPPVTDEDLVRMVPILTGTRPRADGGVLTSGSASTVTADFGGYVILATDADGATTRSRCTSPHWDDHDPYDGGSGVPAGARRRALYERLRRRARGRRPPAPRAGTGLTDELTAELARRGRRRGPRTPLHEIEDKPWGKLEFGVIDPAGWLVRVGSSAA